MAKVCLICNTGVSDTFQQPEFIYIMLEYVLDLEDQEEQIICETCYSELKVAFHFKRTFYQCRRLKLFNLQRMMAYNESQNIYVQQPEQSTYSDIPITGAENQLNILTNVDTTTGVQTVFPNQSYLQGFENIKKDNRNCCEATCTSGTLEQNEATCSTNFYEAQIDMPGPPDEANYTETEHQDEGMVQDLEVDSQEGAEMNGDNNGMDLENGPDIPSNLRQIQCDFCFLTFRTVEEFENHKKNHQEEGHPYRCPCIGCKSRFKYWHSRKGHLKMHSKKSSKRSKRALPERTPWICHYCGRSFPLKEVFDSHLRSHTREISFECEYCFKSFVSNSNLQVHLRIHIKGSPYECGECGRGFTSATRLEFHKRGHAGIRPFQCQMCPSAYTTSGGLIKHWRISSHFRGPIKPPDRDLNNK